MPALVAEVRAGEHVVRVSNPDKVYFRDLPDGRGRKIDLVNYYVQVGEGVVRALFERPCTLKRHPGGAESEAIYQKRVPESRPQWIETARVDFPSGRHADELCVTEVGAVAWAASLGTIDFHPWPSRRRDPDHPDELRIDLDPQPGTDFSHARRVAEQVRILLEELGFTGWPKTSGSRGLHVYVRILPEWTHPQVRRAALAFAREVERRLPGLVTTAWWKEQRGERVFVDYNQNARDRTMASAYSVRARTWAPVSAPLAWDEVADAEPRDFSMLSMPERFARLGDLHAGIDDISYDLSVLLEMAERDERDRGLGDAPYPPHFPKMEGEPKRVQPSRDRSTTSGRSGLPASGRAPSGPKSGPTSEPTSEPTSGREGPE